MDTQKNLGNVQNTEEKKARNKERRRKQEKRKADLVNERPHYLYAPRRHQGIIQFSKCVHGCRISSSHNKI